LVRPVCSSVATIPETALRLFYRITGGLFNPAVTLALWLVGAVSTFRTITLVAAQIVGGIAGSALIAGLTPQAGISTAITTLQTDMVRLRVFESGRWLTLQRRASCRACLWRPS
jgi:glycerol uptake facilitator-like aquaporin